MRTSITIVGASLAGIRAVETLRRDGFDGTITLIGAEEHLPYDRPPLSKDVLAGGDLDRIPLVDADQLADLDVDLRLSTRATSLAPGEHMLSLDDGSTHRYDGLLIATGASVRHLPGTPDIAGIHTLRTLDDCLALRRDFEAGPNRVVVVGAGFIGAEVAATARGRGLEVTMIESLPLPLMRVLGERIGAICADVHRDEGVDLRLGVGVDGIEGDERVQRVRLSDGSAVDADIVVVGIGVVPNTDWLEGSGLEIDNGVVCDETCLAGPDIVAAGDVARWPNRRFGETMRVEHWDNAVEQARHAARRLLQSDNEATPYEPVPWFWSDQYDRKIQLAGRNRPDDELVVVNGSVEERRFAGIYGREGRLTAVIGFNRPRQVMQYRGLIEQGASWDDALAFAAEQA